MASGRTSETAASENEIEAIEPALIPAQAPVDYRFGVIESFDNPVEANNLGVSWTRVRFQWAEVQAGGPGTWTPKVNEGQINGEIGSGRTVVGLLIGIPDWARDGNNLPAGLHLPHNDPGNTWANFVREAVSRYNGRINHWIIWNEPDIGDPNAPGHTWSGSVEDFAQLQRTAYLVAKETNPNATIHLPAFTHFWDPNYIYNFLDVIVADPAAESNNYYFDVITAHLYFQPDSIYNLIQQFYGAVGSRGIPWKPLWLVETNAPPHDDPAWPVSNHTFLVSQNEQAAFVPQALASALAAGAQRIALYKMQDVPGDEAANPEPFGLLRMDGSRRPAYNTYQVAIRYMAGMQGIKREVWGHHGQIKIDQGDYTTTVLFSRLPAPQSVEVPATSNSGVLVDMWGGRRSVSAQNGVFKIDLPGALCQQTAGDYCMIGGEVFYLVQGEDGGSAPGAPAVGGPPPAQNEPEATIDPEATTDPDAPTPEPEETTTPAETAVPTETSTPKPTRTPRPTKTATLEPTATVEPTATNTLEPTDTAVPATEVAALPATPEPTQEVELETAVSPSNNLSFLFIGGALFLAVVIGAVWYKNEKS